PLEMHRTCTSVRDLVAVDNFATPHKTLLHASQPIPWVNWDNMAAAGGLVSSVHDMSQWLRLQLRRGALATGPRLFSEEQALNMWQAHTPIPITARGSARFPSTHFRAYGLGWALSDYKGRKLITHGGGYDGMYSMVLLIPEEQWGIVVLTNSMTSISESIIYRAVDELLGGDRRDWSGDNLELFQKSRVEFRARVDAAIQPSAIGTRPSHALTAYEGTYHDDLYGDVDVTLEDGKLVLRLRPNPLFVADLEHLHFDTFVIRWRNSSAWFDEGTAHFVADARGDFVELKLDVPNDDLWFHELRLLRRDGPPSPDAPAP
ncbi:MAG TPA: serine hydrolase, partial [Pirellulaceae bacterium]